MQRYIKIFEESKYLKEAVINVSNYTNKLLFVFNDLEKDILYKNKKLLNLEWNLNKYFRKYRIRFKCYRQHELQRHDNYRYGLTIAETAMDKFSTIIISCNPNILDIQKDRNIFNEFVKRCIELISHELIHRLQTIEITDLKLKKTFNTSNKEKIEYFSNYHEIMAWAWNALEELRFKQYSDDNIKNKQFNISDSISLWTYTNLFLKDSDVLKRFYKYVYMY